MKIKKYFSVFILTVIFSLIFFACFNDRQGKEASIILNIGKIAGNRAAWPHEKDPDILDNLLYKVVIDGPDHIEIESTGRATIKTTVTPGIYAITVEALYKNEPYAKNSVENITIRAGSNFVPISLKAWNEIPDMDPAKTYLIAEGEKMEFNSLTEALSAARNVPGLEVFTISISDGNHYLNNDYGSIYEEEKVIIEKHGNGTACIKPGDPEYGIEDSGCIFSVYGELTLQGNITLEGVYNNSSALIVVNEFGIFNMYDNVVITKNNNIEGSGGGVCIGEGGKFYMHNGKISGNEASFFGGGVCVNEGGTFIMYDGTISGNRVNDVIGTVSGGGGVYITEGAFFYKKQGIIYGYYGEGNNLWNFDLNGAHSVFLGNSASHIRSTTVEQTEELSDPEGWDG
jgi:hypothetical protein